MSASTIRAAEAPQGFYRARHGQVLEVVARARVDGNWPRRSNGAIPYRIKANPASDAPGEQVARFGWLPPDYPLRPASKPGWWRRADAARVRNLKGGRRAIQSTPTQPAKQEVGRDEA